MTPAFWLAVVFYALAAVWTLAVAWPFMRVTRRAAVEGLAQSARTVNLLAALEADAAQLIAEARAAIAEIKGAAVDLDACRVKRALDALEALPAKVDALAKGSARAALGPVKGPSLPIPAVGFAGRRPEDEPASGR